MRNERLHEGNRISAVVPANTTSGTPVVVLGDVPGVTATAIAEGGNIAGRASVWLEGVFTVSITDAVATEGTKIYIPPAGGALTTTVGTNVLFGRTLHGADGTGGTKGAGAGTVHVRLAKV